MKRIFLSVVFVALLFLAACTAQQPATSQPVAPQPAVQETPVPGANPAVETAVAEDSAGAGEAGESNVREITMTARQWSFDPDTIRVKQGDKVRLEITSTDVKHGFAIEDYNINEQLLPGQITVVEFVADKPGTFRFYCSVVCGAGHSNMEGSLVVE